MEERTMFKFQKFLCLFTCLVMKFKELQSQEIETIIEHLCYNSSLEGFRLNATILEVRNVSSRFDCVDECLADPCCRSVNYKYSTSPNEPNKCEFLHELVENSSSVLEANTSFDHVYIISPQKVYNFSCFPKEGDYKKTYVSCKEVFEKNSSADDGVYYLQLNESSEIYRAYCHMFNQSSPCGGGGWTLVMKLDRDKQTFEYSSPLWTNNKTWNVEEGLDDETKLASYHNTPFTKICLGMSVDDDQNDTEPNYILLNYAASSLYSVIAGGVYHATNVSRKKWMSLIDNSTLQPHCNMEGFNLKFDTHKLFLRIGLVGNNENNCTSPDSLIGFGIQRKESKWSGGNINLISGTNLTAFGYILVQ